MRAILLQLLPPLLGATFVLASQFALAQNSESGSIEPDKLEYYLLQAFQAAKPEERIALNHIGIEVQALGEGYLVTAALEGYPAHQQGIERGDKIISVDGEPFHPIYSFNNIDAEPNEFSAATNRRQLEIERFDAVESVAITPVYENLYDSYRTATLNSVQKFSLGNKTIGYIRFWGLSRSTADIFTLELVMAAFTDSDGMIVDLRNSYGFLSSKHLDLFTRNGRGYFETSGESSQHATITQQFIDGSVRPFTKPMVVLVNSQTRAGAELFAYGLSKLGRITTLGENSPGRIGSYTLNGNSFDYSPAEQTLIDGQNFESIGIAPKEAVSFPFTQTGRSDPQFELSVDILLGII